MNDTAHTPLAVILVAAGASLRFGTDKQLARLAGIPVFLHALRTLLPEADQMVVAIPQGRQEEYKQLLLDFQCEDPRITIVEGGSTRTQSVRNALHALTVPENAIVAIHDAARPLVTANLLKTLADAAQLLGGAAPGRPVTDTLLRSDESGVMTGVQPRQGLWHIATPQVFKLKPLRDAYAAIGSQTFTDDTQVFFNAGHAVKIIQETTENLKITYPEDLLRAEILLKQRKKLFLASPLGYCNGVRHALTMFHSIKEQHPGEPIYIIHALVHNSVITQKMTQDGARFVDSIDDVPEGSIVLFGAHGVTRAVEATARRRNLRVFNAICPNVASLQKVAESAPIDLPLILLGDKAHAEVISILDHAAARKIHLLQSPADADTLPSLDYALFLCQTTRSQEEITETHARLLKRVRHLQHHASACPAVLARQAAMAELAGQCDAAIVIGSHHSANAQRLFELAQSHCTHTELVETAQDIQFDDYPDTTTIALGTATSTPDSITQAVVEKLNTMGYITQPAPHI